MAEPNAADERDRAPLPDRVTMPLLALVTREAVDEDYVHAAQRRAGLGAAPTADRTRLRGAVLVAGVFGLLVALAAVQTARNKDVQQASRDALIDRIDERNSEVDSLTARIRSLQRQNAALQSTSSRVQGQLASATVELGNLQISTGFVPVHGPGVRVTVADNPNGSADGRVRATDLRLLVNGLWQVGAEAIAINGRRLSNISAIINSNISIAVNRSPLTPPYVVSAIGDPDLASRLPRTTSGAEFQELTEEFGFQVSRQNEAELVLPAAPASQLRLQYASQGNGPPDNQEDTQ